MSETQLENQEQARRWLKLWGNISTIERRLVAFLILGGILPLVVVTVLSYLQARSSLRDSVESELQSAANLSEQTVEGWFMERAHDAKIYATLPLEAQDETGIDTTLIQQLLTVSDGTYSAIYLTDAGGRVLERVGDGVDVGQTFGGADFLSQLDSTGFAHSDIVFYEPLDRLTLFFVQRVQSGFVILQTNPDTLPPLMGNFTLEDGQTYLQSGGYLVTPQEIRALDNPPRQPDSSSGVAELDGFGDKDVLSSWVGNSARRTVIYAQVPKGAALSAANTLGVVLFGLTLLAIIGASVVAYMTARSLTRPISRLTEATRDIAGGSWDTELQVDSQDEMGVLAGAFKDMTDNLRVRVYEETRNREYLEQVLTSYMKFVERVSRGDLTARLSLNGQTGDNLIVANVNLDQDDNLLRLGYNLNRMVEALHSMASQARDVASSLSESAVQILDSSTSQISSATQQDASVSQTTSTVSEIRATVAETAERAQMVAESAQQSVEISRQGQIAVAETIEGMNVIRSRVESIAENILLLSERTTQIGDIIATVNAIADQSKMLALNASIEAARAGEEGRGFAVVAMEVRNLAEQSREATAQVRDILSEIQGATNTAVMVTEEGTKGVDLGVQLVDRAGRAIRELAGKLEDASQSAMQIAASTRQQSQGMDQLTSAMSSIKAATSSTATSMQQAQRNAKDLNEMANQMDAAISQYRL